MKRAPSRLATGFTLIELLVTLAILGVLAGGALSFADLAVKRSQEQDLRIALRQIREAIDAYKHAVDTKHIRVAADETGYPHALSELTDGVVDMASPKGAKLYFLRRLPRDPTAEPSIPADQTWGLRSYASDAGDPQPGRDIYDVYSRSTHVAIDGTRYAQW